MYVCVAVLKLFYILVACLLMMLLVRPEVLDSIQCTDDAAFDFNSTTVFEKHHLTVLSLKNIRRGLFVSASVMLQVVYCRLQRILF